MLDAVGTDALDLSGLIGVDGPDLLASRGREVG